MRKLAYTVTCLLVSGVTVMATGSVGLFYSAWDADEAGSSGMGGGIRFCNQVQEVLAMEARISGYNDFDDMEFGIPGYSDFLDAGENFSAMPIELGAAAKLPLDTDQIAIYFGGGIGYYIFPEYELDDYNIDVDPDDVLGYYGVGRVRFNVSPDFGLFIELMVRSVEIDEVEFDGGALGAITVEDLEMEVGGSVINAGVTFLW